MQSGVAYQGVLQAVSPKLSLALALAHDKAKEPSIQNIEELMQLEFADVVSVSVLPDTNSSFSSKGELTFALLCSTVVNCVCVCVCVCVHVRACACACVCVCVCV